MVNGKTSVKTEEEFNPTVKSLMEEIRVAEERLAKAKARNSKLKAYIPEYEARMNIKF